MSLLSERRIDGKHRDQRIIEAIERYLFRIGAPPEGFILRWSTENLLVVNPRGIAVHNEIRPVESELNFYSLLVFHVEIVIFAGVGAHGAVRRWRLVIYLSGH